MHARRTSIKALALAIATVLAGCVTRAPDPQPAPSVELPAEWNTPIPENAAASAWLNDLQDPALNALVEEALADNANLQTAAYRFAQSLAEAGLIRADERPTANFGLDGNRQKINSIGPQSIDSAHFNNYQLGLNISWEIDLWGKLRDRSSAALAQTEAAAAELRLAKQSLVAQIAKRWFDYAEAHALLRLAEETAQSYAQNEVAITTRFEKGLTDRLDLHRIRTQTANALAQVEIEKRKIDALARLLENLLGRYPAAALEPNQSFPPLPLAIPAGLPAELLQRRPDLITAERRLAAAEKNLSANKKDRLPAFSLTGLGGTRSDQFNELLENNFSVWSLAGNLAQPLYQGGRIRANINRSAALRNQAEAQYRDTALRAFREVETALAAESTLRREFTRRAEAAKEADEAEALAWSRYRDGTIPFLDALESQRTANSARSGCILLRNQLLQNRIDLYLALGGPFQDPS